MFVARLLVFVATLAGEVVVFARYVVVGRADVVVVVARRADVAKVVATFAFARFACADMAGFTTNILRSLSDTCFVGYLRGMIFCGIV